MSRSRPTSDNRRRRSNWRCSAAGASSPPVAKARRSTTGPTPKAPRPCSTTCRRTCGRAVDESFAGAEYSGECIETLRYDRVERPHAALLALEEPGTDEHLEMVRHRRLAQAEGFGQVARTRFAALVRGDDRQ